MGALSGGKRALAITGVVVWSLALVIGSVTVAANLAGPSFGDWDEETILGDGDAKIALIRIEGEILPGRGASGLFGETFAAEDWIDQIRQADDDDEVAGVILLLDTPGGAVVASDDVYRAVRDLDLRKPVIASMGEVAASGGYYIASGARSIVANASTITGSIGAVAMFLNLEGTADKLGLKPVVIKSGRHKDIGSPYRDMTAEERKIIQSLIDGAYDGFVAAVAEGRGLTEERVRAIADGRIWSGRDAMGLKLVDSLGGLEEAFDVAKRAAGVTDARLVEFSRPPPSLFSGPLGVRGVDLGRVFNQAKTELGVFPSRSGLHYLWVR